MEKSIEMFQYPQNLLHQIFLTTGEDWDIERMTTADNIEGLELAISLLKERDQEIVNKRFKEHKTLQQIGDELSLTRERVRQLLFRALKSMQRQESRRYIIFGRKGYDSKIAQAQEAKRKNPPIEELDLDTRSYNALRHAKILTIPQLSQKTDEELLKVKCFGVKSLKLTRKALNRYFKNKAGSLSFS